MEIKGKFEPPAMGQRHVPLAIAGDGLVSVANSKLHLEGFQGGSDRSCLMAAVVVFAILGLPFLALSAGIEVNGKILGAVVIAPLIFYFSGKKKNKTTEPLILDVPAENIKSISVNQQTQVVEILIVNQKPKGLVYFVPSSDPGTTCNELKAALKME